MKFVINNNSKLLYKEQITPNVYRLKYSFVKDFEWIPGQYVGITINPTYRRSYSILGYDGENLEFLIDTKPGGIASRFFDQVEVGHINQILGPYGKFNYQKTKLDKVFICTGTGIVPFVPMIKELYNNKVTEDFKIRLFFGTRYSADDYTLGIIDKYISEEFEYHQCITRENTVTNDSPRYSRYKGRVTEVIPRMNYDWINTEFYICGNPDMVVDMELILKSKGAEKLYLEKY